MNAAERQIQTEHEQYLVAATIKGLFDEWMSQTGKQAIAEVIRLRVSNARLVALVRRMNESAACRGRGRYNSHAPDCPVAAEIAALCGEEAK